MRKEFLKEVEAEEAEASESGEAGSGDTDSAPSTPEPDNDETRSVEEPPSSSQNTSFEIPKDPEAKKKAVQRFLFFINSIRLMMNSYRKRHEKLTKAFDQDEDYSGLVKKDEPTETDGLPAPEEPADEAPAPVASEGLIREEPETPDIKKILTEVAADKTAELLVGPLIKKIEDVLTAAAAGGAVAGGATGGTSLLITVGATILRIAGVKAAGKIAEKLTAYVIEKIITPILNAVPNNFYESLSGVDDLGEVIRTGDPAKIKKFFEDNYLQILKQIVIQVEPVQNKLKEIQKLEFMGLPVGAMVLEELGLDVKDAVNALGGKDKLQSYVDKNLSRSDADLKALGASKAKSKVYLKNVDQTLNMIKGASKGLEDLANLLNNYYGGIREQATEIDMNTVMAFLSTYKKKSDFEKVKDLAIYDGGPKLGKLMQIYRYMQQETKKQNEIIGSVKNFLGDERPVKAGEIGSIKTSTQVATDKATDAALKELAPLERQKVIDYVSYIKKDNLSETLLESPEGDDLADGLASFITATTDYSAIINDEEAEPSVKTPEDLESYLKFIKENPPQEIEEPVVEPEATAEEPDTSPVIDTDSDTPSGSLEEETKKKDEKLKKFFEKTKFVISPEIYSPKFRETINAINKKMKEYYEGNAERSKTFLILYKIANLVLPEDPATETELMKYIDLGKLFSESAEIPGVLKPAMVQAILIPPPTSESLMERLIKQELKVLNGKKMVRN